MTNVVKMLWVPFSVLLPLQPVHCMDVESLWSMMLQRLVPHWKRVLHHSLPLVQGKFGGWRWQSRYKLQQKGLKSIVVPYPSLPDADKLEVIQVNEYAIIRLKRVSDSGIVYDTVFSNSRRTTSMSSSGRWLRTSSILFLIVLAIALVIILIVHPLSDTKSVNVSTILTDIKTDINKNQHVTLDVATGTITLTRGNSQNAPKEQANINDTFDVTKVLSDNQISYTNNHL